ncbi:MAG: monovalent cation/H(+) antiporter subunit G [Casimicrobiaceae bacterium]|nr:monovalent cation/H(+) antiporter subunit G [Casimicrobiaceae bacterium]MCX8098685.1 monovalent cation/H(+) antiporter subunit G [Casimicrobiaceae bacterium]MDW8311834.1 monovalent cation/H(+) antiporter subunit G [Burkholderiales bacterium]
MTPAAARLPELPLALDLLAAALLVAGAFFALVGSWGLAKLSRFMLRIHGPTKATTLGVGSVLTVSLVLSAAQGTLSGRELLITLFLFMTAPVSAFVLAQTVARHLPQEAPPPPPEGTAGEPPSERSH